MIEGLSNDPQKLIDTVMRICHDDMSGGHLGLRKPGQKFVTDLTGKRCMRIQRSG